MKATIYNKFGHEIKNFEILNRHEEYKEKLNPYIVSSEYQIGIENTDRDICFYLKIINFIVPRKKVLRIDDKETILI